MTTQATTPTTVSDGYLSATIHRFEAALEDLPDRYHEAIENVLDLLAPHRDHSPRLGWLTVEVTHSMDPMVQEGEHRLLTVDPGEHPHLYCTECRHDPMSVDRTVAMLILGTLIHQVAAGREDTHPTDDENYRLGMYASILANCQSYRVLLDQAAPQH
jgi:hypothetical protein